MRPAKKTNRTLEVIVALSIATFCVVGLLALFSSAELELSQSKNKTIIQRQPDSGDGFAPPFSEGRARLGELQESETPQRRKRFYERFKETIGISVNDRISAFLGSGYGDAGRRVTESINRSQNEPSAARKQSATQFRLDKYQRENEQNSLSRSSQTSASDSWSESLDQLVRSSGLLGKSNRRRDEIVLPGAVLNEVYSAPLSQNPALKFEFAKLTQGFLPKGLFIVQTSGMLSGTPAEIGIFRFEAQSRDEFNASKTSWYRLSVSSGGADDEALPLEIASTQLEVGQIGAEYAFQLRARGGKSPHTWSAKGLPDGIELDMANGVLAGTPETEGEFAIAFTLQDAEGKTVGKSLTLIVRASPLFVTTSALEGGQIERAYQTRLAAQGGEPPYLWDLAGGNLPAGLVLDPLSGVLSGVPTEKHEGLLRVRVMDTEGKTDSADLPLEIRASSLAVASPAIAEAFEAQNYSFSLQAVGGTPPYNWSMNSGSLPPGMVLSAGGQLSGNPAAHGEFTFAVTVSDAEQQTASRTFRARVQENADAEEDDEEETQETPSPTGSPDSGGGDTDDEDATLENVRSFSAIPSNRKAGLVWESARASGIRGVVVVRNREMPPSSITDGVVVYSGTGVSFLDEELEAGTYHYAVFSDYGEKGISEPDSSARATINVKQISLSATPSPYADRVFEFSPIDARCYGCSTHEALVTGPPKGSGDAQGSADVVSLGARVNDDNGQSAPYGGSITLEFTDNLILDGPGIDFTIFENAFRLAGTDRFFVEPATVEVSQDGKQFYRFPFDYVPHFNDDGTINFFNPFSYPKGFAGVRAVYSNNGAPPSTNTVLAGGDSFDLNDLPGAPLPWIRFVRITSTGDRWLEDQQGDAVRHSNEANTWAASGKGNSGFDLDAIVAVNF
jgi:hypothetical protein